MRGKNELIAQKGSLDVTRWLLWFVRTLNSAIRTALDRTNRVVSKMQFWDRHRFAPLNDRQRKVLNMLLDGQDGKLTSSKWYKINHCSQDTAGRDLNDLVSKGILLRSQSGGRSTSYSLAPWYAPAL